MNNGQISKLQYDTIKGVIQTTRKSVSIGPLSHDKLSKERIAHLIRNSQNHNHNQSDSELVMQDVLLKGVDVMKSFAQINVTNDLIVFSCPDKSSITVKQEPSAKRVL